VDHCVVTSDKVKTASNASAEPVNFVQIHWIIPFISVQSMSWLRKCIKISFSHNHKNNRRIKICLILRTSIFGMEESDKLSAVYQLSFMFCQWD
jgi:hypothetical protein